MKDNRDELIDAQKKAITLFLKRLEAGVEFEQVANVIKTLGDTISLTSPVVTVNGFAYDRLRPEQASKDGGA